MRDSIVSAEVLGHVGEGLSDDLTSSLNCLIILCIIPSDFGHSCWLHLHQFVLDLPTVVDVRYFATIPLQALKLIASRQLASHHITSYHIPTSCLGMPSQ